ncbi:MAG: hypothetical protein RJA98_3618 [Pseudomonadota bacterium]|jgi:hypothetical protein
MSTAPYKRLAYVSRAAAGITARDAYDIIRVSVNRNCRLQLTGGLVFIDQHFVQVLEGHPDSVDARYAVIAADPRHEAIQLRQSANCDALLFAQDWMAFSSDAQIQPALRAQFGINAANPLHLLPPEALVAFVLACCKA